MGDLTKNFNRSEFLCHCGRCEYSKVIAVSPKLVEVLQGIRDAENVPLKVSSGARCAFRNQQTPGAASKSWHVPREDVLYAADVTFAAPNMRTPNGIVRLYVRADQGRAKGLGLYHGRIHLDFRPGSSARWVDVGWSWANFAESG